MTETRFSIRRAAVAILLALFVGQIFQVVLAFGLDAIYGAAVTGGRWTLNSANIILNSATSIITGFIVGRISRKKGMLLAAVANFLPLICFVLLSVIRNEDAFHLIHQQYDTAPALWVWLGLIPALAGGKIGELSSNPSFARVSLNKLAVLLAVPLGLLNAFAFIVAAIWLAILGEWGIICTGIAALLVSRFFIGTALMPSILLAAPAAMFYKKGSKLGFFVFGSISALYTLCVLTVWCIGSLYIFGRQATSISIIPILLWSYNVATGPITMMAKSETQGGGGEGSVIWAFFAQIAYFMDMFAVLLFHVSGEGAAILFVMIMLVGMAFQFRMVFGADPMPSNP